MWPLRPTAIATPGAPCPAIAVLTILSSLPARSLSSPELLSPSSGATYLIGGGGAAAELRAWGGRAPAPSATIKKTIKEVKVLIRTTVGYRCVGAGGTQGPLIFSRKTIVSALHNVLFYLRRALAVSGPARECSS